MRVSNILGSLVAMFAAVVTLTVATESRAGDEALVSVKCAGGNVHVTAAAPWHVNDQAPWKWDKGDKVSLDKDGGAKFKGAKCEGTVKAYVCNGDACKGPIPVPVK